MSGRVIDLSVRASLPITRLAYLSIQLHLPSHWFVFRLRYCICCCVHRLRLAQQAHVVLHLSCCHLPTLLLSKWQCMFTPVPWQHMWCCTCPLPSGRVAAQQVAMHVQPADPQTWCRHKLSFGRAMRPKTLSSPLSSCTDELVCRPREATGNNAFAFLALRPV